MRVKIEVTVDIDPAVWTLNFGVEGAQAIRKDVKDYARYFVEEGFRNNGLLNEEGQK